jgi:hypothetical protein
MRQISRFIRLTIGLLGALPVQAAARVRVSVAQKRTIESNRTQHTGGYVVLCQVINETGGGGSTQFQITCPSSGPVTCDSIRPTTMTIFNGCAHEGTVFAAEPNGRPRQTLGRRSSAGVHHRCCDDRLKPPGEL